MISDDISPTVIFPILENGSLDDPMAGDYHYNSGVLENVYLIDISKITRSKSNCSIDLDCRLTKKVEYNYDLRTRSKVPIFNENNTSNQLC